MQMDLPGFLYLYHSLGGSRSRTARLLQLSDGDLQAALRAGGIDRARTSRRVATAVDADLDWARQPGRQLVSCLDDAFPPLLHQIPDYPVLLYVDGDADLLKLPQIAMVGSRNCTPGGAQNAFDFAMQCAAAGLAVTSGMALGIDSAAHRGALEMGGVTIAVIGTGADRVYPSRNRRLARRIAESGAVVSEFPLGTGARAANFPQRNRLISGLSIATLVVEATARSGSLITARLAAEQGREVFALPGSIHNPQARGCHRLIRDGATLVESAADIGAELDSLYRFTSAGGHDRANETPESLDRDHRNLLETIGYDPVHCDLLAERSSLTMDKLSSMLVTLELNDLIQSVPGGRYVRI